MITTFPLGSLQTNCYLVQDGSCCVLIDPGDSPDFLLRQLEQRSLTLDAILLTHGHFDHVGAVRDLAAETGCRVYLHTEELTLPPAMTAGPLYYTNLYDTTVEEAGLRFDVLHTPGHTPGSVCLRCGENLFSGDTLFAGSFGRTDFPGGSIAQMHTSLRLLASIPGNLMVYPGHGPATTLDEERQSNPYL